jgi:hypothetical protein
VLLKKNVRIKNPNNRNLQFNSTTSILEQGFFSIPVTTGHPAADRLLERT